MIETTPTIYADGQPVQPDAYYTSVALRGMGMIVMDVIIKMNRVIPAGIQLGIMKCVKMVHEAGITYEGYYIIATSQSIPMCTIVEISNHSIEGEALRCTF